MNPRSTKSSFLNAKLNSCMEQVERAMDAGSSGEEAYRLLVSELNRKLDTRVCRAALWRRLMAFRTCWTDQPPCFWDAVFSRFLDAASSHLHRMD